MQRDLDLIRAIVLKVEALPTGFALGSLKIDGYTDEQVGYHNFLICKDGLAEGIKVTTISDLSPQYDILNLNPAGHDFAEAARNEAIWAKARGKVVEVGAGATLDVMKDTLVSMAKDEINRRA